MLAPEGLGSLPNRPSVPAVSPMSGRAPVFPLSNSGTAPSSTSPHSTLKHPVTGGANSKYNFPGELGMLYTVCILVAQHHSMVIPYASSVLIGQ